MAAATHSAASVPTPAGPPLGGIPEVREVCPGEAVTVHARSGTHLLDAATTAAVRVEADQ
jgi:hypothetical protein